MTSSSTEHKVIIVGDSSVGKSSIVTRYHCHSFCGDHQSTVGASFVTQTIHSRGGKVVVNIWDTAGQEKYRSLVPMYSRNASAAVIVFDQSLPDGFDPVAEWYSSLRANAPEDCRVVVAGNKSDLPAAVERDKAFAWAKENGVELAFVSAKTGDGIEELFQTIGELIPARRGVADVDVTAGEGAAQGGCC